MRKLVFVVLLGAVLLSSVPTRAQDFIGIDPDEIDQVLNLFSAFSAGGLFHTAKLHKLGGFDIGLQGVAVFPPEKYQDIIGGPFEDVNFVGLPYLCGSVGLPLNLEAVGRFFYFPLADEPSEGGVTIAGLGLKYGILQKSVLPRITVMAHYTAFFVPEEYSFGTVNTVSLKAIVSKKFLIFDIYGGIGWDRTSLELDYELTPGVPLTGSFDSDNIHGNIGLTVHPLPMLFISADYMTTEDFSGFNIGAGLTFR